MPLYLNVEVGALSLLHNAAAQNRMWANEPNFLTFKAMFVFFGGI